MFEKVYIPYRGYYSTPFCRWQGSLQHENAIILGAKTANRWLKSKDIPFNIFTAMYYGSTVGQPGMFYSHNWAAAMMVENKVPLPAMMINQACTTSSACLSLLASNVELGLLKTGFVLVSDRCSNGPHTVWPNPIGPGGELIWESWLMDNFNRDPNVGLKMVQTAENVAGLIGATKEQADEVTLRRYEQYQDSLAGDRAFQKRYMFPVEAMVSRKQTIVVEADEGIIPTTKEGLAGLKPVEPHGIHSFGSQTFPADGNIGFIVTTRDMARELSADPNVEIRVVSYGFARSKKGYMAAAPVPAAKMALRDAGIGVSDLEAVKTHNPFAINDIYLSTELGFDVMWMNNYGCSLIYGHPQGPTGGRNICELIEELVMSGGGYGLWAGCAAGDTASSMVLKVHISA